MSLFLYFIMDNYSTRNWNICCWNVRGLNSEARQRAVREKIEESRCAIICLRETKCTSIDQSFIHALCPRRFNQFSFVPSRGASGGILTIWNSSIFDGLLVDSQDFGLVTKFTSKHNAKTWTLVNVYAPCEQHSRDNFMD